MTHILVYLREPERSALQLETLNDAQETCVHVVSSVEEARPFLAESEVLITLAPHLAADTATLLRSMPRLRWVQLITTGADDIPRHLAGRDVALTTTRGLHGRQMSEAAIGAMLALSRQMPHLFRNQQTGTWQRFPAQLLAGRTVGILGLGAIADALAPRCRALGMRVIGITATPRPLPDFDEVRSRRDIAAALADLDHLVLLAPYSADTHRLIDGPAMRAMKQGAFIVNLARGGILDEGALLAALDDDHLAGAALDVFEQEPLAAASPLWDHPKVIVTPHIGGLHNGYAADVIALISDNLRRFRGQDPGALHNIVPLPEPLCNASL